MRFIWISVGAGAAGCIVAGRLSESGNYTVLLIEAGGVPHHGLDIPALVGKYRKETNVIKNYHSVPQKTAGLRNGGRIDYAVGQVLGGGASVNGMMFNRGSPYDYDNWAHITGDVSWNYENMLPYFKKLEDYRGAFPSEREHGKGGPITVSQPKYAPGLEEWLKAGEQLGYTRADPNGPEKVSFTPTEYNKKKGRRVSSYRGYIEPFLQSRPNLKVLVNSTVKRVVFKGNRAVGVVYETEHKGKVTKKSVKARKEIIISAGVVASPALLMKSGVGPEDILKSSGITPVKYLPVGHNFQDHAHVSLRLLLNERSEVFVPERDLNESSWEIYNKTGDGPYSINAFQMQAFLVSSAATRPPLSSTSTQANDWPDLQFQFAQSTTSAAGVTPEEVGAKPNEHIVANLIFLTRPKSAGRVILNSSDPLNSDPLLDYNFYSHPEDLKATLEGINTTLHLFEGTKPYQRAGVRFSAVPIPECKDTPFRSQEYWLCYIRHTAGSGRHGAGTCRMGKVAEDSKAVVDSKLKVIGIQNLRVVDCSIMPNATNTNIMVAAYVIGEKAADIILKESEKY